MKGASPRHMSAISFSNRATADRTSTGHYDSCHKCETTDAAAPLTLQMSAISGL